jgi:hypothetical protein
VDEPNVFPCAIGRSFYENVLPPEHVHVGWSSYAAVWLSRIPMLIPDPFFPLHSTSAVRAAFESQAAQDWEAFLSLRASELRPGGSLVVVLPGATDDGLTGLQDLFDHANTVLAEMVAEGAIMAAERARMVMGSLPRRKCDLLAPFMHDGQFRRLIVELCEMSELEDPRGPTTRGTATSKPVRLSTRGSSAPSSCPRWRPRSRELATSSHFVLSPTGWRTA